MKDELNHQTRIMVLRETKSSVKKKRLKARFHPSAFRLHPSESGAALVGLLALMAIMAMVFLAAAPTVYQQVQREKEREAIRRGDEIADAIRIFAFFNRRLPNNMDELLEGVQIPGKTKRLMILRESAAKDPLSSTGEWKLIRSNELKTLSNFQRKVANFTGSTAFSNPEPKQLFDPILGTLISTVNTETSEETDPPGDEDDSDNIDAPFVGVASRARTKSVITFYGIERHDWWIFTPLLRGTGNNGQNNLPPNNLPPNNLPPNGQQPFNLQPRPRGK